MLELVGTTPVFPKSFESTPDQLPDTVRRALQLMSNCFVAETGNAHVDGVPLAAGQLRKIVLNQLPLFPLQVGFFRIKVGTGTSRQQDIEVSLRIQPIVPPGSAAIDG